MTKELSYAELKKANFFYYNEIDNKEFDDDEELLLSIETEERSITIEAHTELGNFEPIDSYNWKEYERVLSDIKAAGLIEN